MVTAGGGVLVVGGAGYIGSHVARQLHASGRNTIVYDNLSTGHRELARWGTFIQADTRDRETLVSVLREHRVQTVIHLAAHAYVGESCEQPLKYYDNNVAGTVSLLEAMLEASVKEIIFSSTCATYGEASCLRIAENEAQKPVNPYGRSKLFAEHIIDDCRRAHALRYVALRYFNAAGADPAAEIGEWHEPEPHLIPRVLDVALGHTDHVNVYGTDYPTADGTCVRDYVHVADVARAHLLAIEHLRENESGVFNLGSEGGFSVHQVVDEVARVTGAEVRTRPCPRRAGDPAILVSSSQRAREVLGWRPELSRLADIVETAWRWHRRLRGADARVRE